MPRHCVVYGCRGNFKWEPYTKTVSFPSEKETRQKWRAAMPNDPASLLEEIWVCVTHFEGEWATARGGRRPINPPSIFPGIPKSCLKQVQNKQRPTRCGSAEMRRKSEEATNDQ